MQARQVLHPCLYGCSGWEALVWVSDCGSQAFVSISISRKSWSIHTSMLYPRFSGSVDLALWMSNQCLYGTIAAVLGLRGLPLENHYPEAGVSRLHGVGFKAYFCCEQSVFQILLNKNKCKDALLMQTQQLGAKNMGNNGKKTGNSCWCRSFCFYLYSSYPRSHS